MNQVKVTIKLSKEVDVVTKKYSNLVWRQRESAIKIKKLSNMT
jgi:hypothetical protein